MTSVVDFNIEDAIATRQFDLKDGREVHAYFWKPVYFPAAPEEGTYEYYRCHFQIIGNGRDKILWAEGVDSIQALMLALQVASTILYNSKTYESGDLTYLGGRDLSLSLSDGMRTDRQGYEKADLLNPPGHITIVQLPDQNFASVVLQGEYLNSLSHKLTEISQMIKTIHAEAYETLEPVAAYLVGTLEYYEAECRRAGLHLPYVK